MKNFDNFFCIFAENAIIFRKVCKKRDVKLINVGNNFLFYYFTTWQETENRKNYFPKLLPYFSRHFRLFTFLSNKRRISGLKSAFCP